MWPLRWTDTSFCTQGPLARRSMFCFWSESLDKKYTAAAGECWRFVVFPTLKIELRFRETETELASRERDLNSRPEKRRRTSEPDGLQSSSAAQVSDELINVQSGSYSLHVLCDKQSYSKYTAWGKLYTCGTLFAHSFTLYKYAK